jgi:ankyrin repeat protein
MSRYNPTYSIDKNTSSAQVSSIMLKISSGNYVDITRSISNNKSYLDIKDEVGRTPLHYLLTNTSIDNSEKFNLSKVLVNKGAPIDIPDDNNVRPLHLAVSQQNYELAEYLLEHGAEPNSKDNSHWAPLHYALSPNTSMCKTNTINIDAVEDNNLKSVAEKTIVIGHHYIMPFRQILQCVRKIQ